MALIQRIQYMHVFLTVSGAGTVNEEVAAKCGLKRIRSHPCRRCKGGGAPRRQEILAGGIPLALQAAVRKWVRAGSLVQVVAPSNLKQYW